MNPGIMKLIPDTNPPRYPLILRPMFENNVSIFFQSVDDVCQQINVF